MPEFRPWPKIARLNRDCIITEKIDGTNAAVGITEDGDVYAQSRTRIITPANDNFGFAAWVAEHADWLRQALGVGLHFGEWWGSGIQRGYGMPAGVRHFSVFNVKRFAYLNDAEYLAATGDIGVRTVPVLYEGPFLTEIVEDELRDLVIDGSHVAPFGNPEGVVVHHVTANVSFKVTVENDQSYKGEVK